MTSLHRDDAQLMLPVVEPADADAERVSATHCQIVSRVAARDARRSARPRLTAEHLRAVAAPPDADADLVRAAEGDRLLLTVPEAARLLHIGRRQGWELVWRGELPVVRLGRSVRVARPVLERFVAERSAPYGA